MATRCHYQAATVPLSGVGGAVAGVGPLSDVQGAELGPFLPSATKLRQGHIFTPICHSVHGGGGVCLSECWDTPPGQTPPSPLGRHPQQPVRILLKCILVLLVF